MRRQNLINARKSLKLTQSELAILIGVTKQSISNLETGVRGTSTNNWDKLEDIFSISQRKLREVFEKEKPE